MAGKKRKTGTGAPQAWENIPRAPDSRAFVRLFCPMLYSVAWSGLRPREMMLYVWMKCICWKGPGVKSRPAQDFPGVAEYSAPEVFYFTWADAQKTGLYGAGVKKAFYSDRDALIRAGFIDDLTPYLKSGNGKAKVYRFSTRWSEPKN